jgi:uncharacterized protein YbjQ (UPF0145 family)
MQRSHDQVAQGGIPLDAEHRLKRLRESHEPTPVAAPAVSLDQTDWTQTYRPRSLGRKRPLFTSNLSVSELALSAAIGLKPLGQVMGASTYHVGWQFNLAQTIMLSMELTVLTEAHMQARRLALGRLQYEATLLGADGVIGVRMQRKNSDIAADIIEYVAIGTAVRLPGDSRWNPPFVAPVTVQELWLLMQAGHFPVGLVYGGCVYYHVATFDNRMASGDLGGMYGATLGGALGIGSSYNIELTDYTSAIYNARSIAMQRAEYEALALRADGIVGVEVEKKVDTHEVDVGENNYAVVTGAVLAGRRHDLIVHFSATGSAIMPSQGAPYAVNYQVPLD